MVRLFIECAVRAALIALVTAVVLRTLRITSAAARHTAWTGVLLTMLLLPVWTAWGPKAPIRLLPPVRQSASPATPLQNVVAPSVRLTEMRQVTPSAPRPASRNWTWPNPLLILYAIGASVLLGRLAIGTARTHRLIRRANVQDGRGISSDCACPITVGWLRPVVILPENWQDWPPQKLDAVLIHEREHVRRHDPLIQRLALVNRALFWFHPLAWWLERKLSVLAEEACDAAVLASGHTPQEYSEYLLDLASSVARSGSRLGIVGMAMPGSFLRQRIRHILDSGAAVPVSRTRVLVAVVACATSSALLASGVLDHVRERVQPASRAVPAPLLQPAAAKPELVPAAAPVPPVRETTRVLLAQAAPNPPAQPPQQARTTPPPDSAEKESQLQAAFTRTDPIADIPIAMELNYFQSNSAEYFVPLTLKIPSSELALARNGGAQQTSFDFLGQIKDEFGVTVANVRDKVSVSLIGAQAGALAATSVEYDAGFVLLPGRYTLKLLARNNDTGRMGTYETRFAIPNLNKQQETLPISSVVLSNQRVQMPGADGTGPNPRVANPLAAGGQKLIPNVTRIFSKSREMFVYLQAYPRDAGDPQTLIASAAFYQGTPKPLGAVTFGFARNADPKSKPFPLNFSIPLSGLQPGNYTCRITVTSYNTGKAATWEAPVVIEP